MKKATLDLSILTEYINKLSHFPLPPRSLEVLSLEEIIGHIRGSGVRAHPGTIVLVLL